MQWKIFKSPLNFLLYSNLLIATAAYAQVQRFRLLDHLNGLQWINHDALAVFFGTWCIYSILRLVKINDGSFRIPDPRVYQITSHQTHLLIIVTLTAILGFYYFVLLNTGSKLLLLGFSFIALGYGIPLWFGKFPLRQLPYLKSFIVPVVWGVIAVLLPAKQEGELMKPSTVLLFAERFLFVFAITVPFDIRDIANDRAQNIATLPVVLGVKRVINWAAVALLACAVVMILLTFGVQLSSISIATCSVEIFIYIIAAVLIYASQREQHDYFYSGLIDGLMILEPILLCIVSMIAAR